MTISFHILISLKSERVLQQTASQSLQAGDWCDMAALACPHIVVPGNLVIPDRGTRP